MRSVLLVVLMIGVPAAYAGMWKCSDRDGNVLYTNIKADANGCKLLSPDPVNTAPAPRAQQKPVNFPSVRSDTQRQRDIDRRRILEQEMVQEQQQLALAKKQLAEQKGARLEGDKTSPRAIEERLRPYEDKIRLHESNLESLKKEIANVK